MKKKEILLTAFCYLLWGLLPLYWALLVPLDAMFILGNRILWAGVFTAVLLLMLGRSRQIKEVLLDKARMKYLVPAALLVTANWGLFIWAVVNGHMLDASLGYFLNPLVIFACGVFLFKEKCGKLEISALVLAISGVVILTLQIGQFPVLAFAISISFTSYSVVKRYAHVDALVSVCVETTVVSPLALLFLLFAPASAASLAIITPLQIVLCVGAGVVTAIPLVLFSRSVNNLPFIIVGFLQYITPTLLLIIGIAQGEPFTAEKAVGYGLIWVALVIFSVGMVRRGKVPNSVEAQQAGAENGRVQ